MKRPFKFMLTVTPMFEHPKNMEMAHALEQVCRDAMVRMWKHVEKKVGLRLVKGKP